MLLLSILYNIFYEAKNSCLPDELLALINTDCKVNIRWFRSAQFSDGGLLVHNKTKCTKSFLFYSLAPTSDYLD